MIWLHKNNFKGSEDDLVKSFLRIFKDESFLFGDKYIKGECYEQIRVPEIGRRSDLIIKCGDRRLINIEFKLRDHNYVLKQAKDHLHWADYSYICMPMNHLSFLYQGFFLELIESGIGLMVGNDDTFIQVLRAKHNTYKKGKDKQFRLNVLNRLVKK